MVNMYINIYCTVYIYIYGKPVYILYIYIYTGTVYIYIYMVRYIRIQDAYLNYRKISCCIENINPVNQK